MKDVIIYLAEFDRKNLFKLASILAVMIAIALPISTALVNVLFVLVPLLVVLSGDLKEKFDAIKDNSVAMTFFLFFVMFVVGCFYTTAPLHDMLHTLLKYDKFFLILFLFPIFSDNKWRNIAVNAFVATVLITVLLSYFKFFVLSHFFDSLFAGAKQSQSSIFKNYIQASFLVSICFYILLIEFSKYKKFWWILVPIILLLLFDLFFMNKGRTGYIVTAALIVLFCWQKFRWEGMLAALLAIVLGTICLFHFSTNFSVRMDQAYKNVELNRLHSSVGLRTSFFRHSVNIIKHSPVIGFGTGSFIAESKNIKDDSYVPSANPHNEYLNIGVQFGLVGVAFLFFMFGWQWYKSYSLPEKWRFIAQGIIVSIMVGSLANSWLMDTTEGHLYVYFMAVIFSAL
ncbi:MAG: O-antigen ligase family protein [Gammaproteobacteria bacterium]|nr:O-antigen ligase family protein [Gammaproteobacteria bacterium]